VVTQPLGAIQSAAAGRIAYLRQRDLHVTEDGTNRSVFQGLMRHIRVVISSNGKLLVGLGDTFRVYELPSGRTVFEQERVGDAGVIGRMIWSPDGRWAAASGRGHVYLWDSAGWRCCWRLRSARDRWCNPVAFSPDGRWVVVNAPYADDNVSVWDLSRLQVPPAASATSRPLQPTLP
jgi:WD40 repeat protein